MNISPRLQPYLIAALAVIALTGLTAYDLYLERGLATQDARNETASLARVLEQQARQTLRRIELALDAAAVAGTGGDAAIPDRLAAERTQLAAALPADGLLRGFERLDAQGRVVVSTLPDESASATASPARIDRSARPWFASRRSAVDSKLGFGAVEQDAQGRWSMPVSRRLASPQGHFDGLVVAWVDAAYLQPILAAVDTGSNGFVTMFLTEGWLVANAPANPALYARNWFDTPLFKEHLPHSPAGTVQQVMVRDGTERLYSYRALADYPIVMSIGVSLTDALADWRTRIVWHAAGLALVAALLAAAAVLMSRTQARRETAEHALADSARHTQAIVSHMAEAIVTIDRQGRIESVNRAGEAIYGSRESELVGRDARVLMGATPRWMRDAPDPQVLLESLVASRRQEGRGLHRNGNIFPVEVSITRIERAGEPIYIALVRDITLRKRQEAELAGQRAALEVMNRELEDFAFFSSHDLQEPLRKIRSFAQLLQQRTAAQLDEKSLHYLAYIEEAGARLQALVRSLLDYSRTSRGALDIEPVDLNRLVAAVLDDLSPAIAQAHAQVSVGPLPTVVADATQLRLVLQNLLSNALKFRNGTHAEIAVEARLEANFCRIEVRDNGIGIDPKYHSTIFHSFKRLHTRDEYPGTGLGLAICNRVAERHGGSLRVESTPGRGSVFTLLLPVLDPLHPAARLPDPAEPRRPLTQSESLTS